MVASRGEWVQPGGWPGVRVLVPADEAGVVRAAWAALAPDLDEAAAGAALLRSVTGQVAETTRLSLAEQLGLLDAPAPAPASAFAQAAFAGEIAVGLTFGGQAQAWLDELAGLWSQPEARPVIEAAADALADELAGPARLMGLHPFGLDVRRWIEDPAARPPAHALADGPVSQPMIFVTQMAQLAAQRRLGLASEAIDQWAAVATGHSQGIVSAIVAAEGHGPERLAARTAQVARLLMWQGVEMQVAWGRGGEGAPMLAVSGWPRARVLAHLQGLDGTLTLTNTADRFVVSGTPASIATLQARIARTVAKAEAANAKSKGVQEPPPVVEALATSAPFHSRWMADAVAPIQAHAARLGVRFDPKALRISVLRYEDGRPWDGTPDLFESMCLNPVDWHATCRGLSRRNVSHVVDLGPGAGVAALAGLNLAGQGVRVLAGADKRGQAALSASRPDAFAVPTRWASYAPVSERADDGLKLRNRFTAFTGCAPVFLPGMTPTTADAPIVAAAANAGLFAEWAGGGQPTEAILRARADELRATLAPGAGYIFNALYLDPHLWGLHLGRHKLVLRLKAEGHPIDGVTVSAGLPPVDEAVALLAEWRAAGLTQNSFKAGSDAQIEHVLRIADADGGDVILQVEGGRAGGHHGFHDLEGLLVRWYGRIRRRPNVLLAVGGGVGDGERVQALLDGTWAHAHDRPVMPVDAVFVGTLAMACVEAQTAPAVKRALAAAGGSPKLLGRGDVDGAVRSGRSGLGADIHYLDNHAGRVAALLDEVAGDPAAAAARHAEIAEALSSTAKPWFGPLDGTYRALLDRLVDLMAIGRGGPCEDGVWLAPDHRARFGDTLRRALQRCECAGPLPTDADLDDPRAAVQRAAHHCPALATRPVLLEDQRWFVASVCKRPGKPVPFVPVIDGDVHRWFTRDALWQSHDPRFDAEGVLVIPGPTAVAGIDRVDEPVAELFQRLMAPAAAAAPLRSGPTDDPVAVAQAAPTVTWAGAAVLNPVPNALKAGAGLRQAGQGARLRVLHRDPTGGEHGLALDLSVDADRGRVGLPGAAAELRRFYRGLLPERLVVDAQQVAAYRRATRDHGAQTPLQILFAAALPALLRAVLADDLGADPLSLLHAESVVRREGTLAAATVAVTLDGVTATDTPAGRQIRAWATAQQGERVVGRLEQVFLVRRAEGPAPEGTACAPVTVATGSPLARPRRILDGAELYAPVDMAAFAVASGDLNPIHSDPALAALAGLPAPIVHGQWTAAAAGALLGSLQAVRARFLAPVALGARLTVTADVVARHEGAEVIEVTVADDRGPVVALTAHRAAPPTAVVCPGQGCQTQGMGQAARERSPAADAVWARADAHTQQAHGFSLVQVVRDNPKALTVKGEVVRHPEGVLHVTQFTQVALTVLAVAGVAELREAGALPTDALFCGHSVGEYSALSAMTEVLPLEALIDVVYHRGLTMQHFVPRDAEGRSDFGMGVIRPHIAGLDAEQALALVQAVRREADAPLYVVNHNVRGRQYAVAGHVRGLAALAAKLPAKAWVRLTGIDVPFHSPLLSDGVPAFRQTLQRCIPQDVAIDALVGRYVPNLVARPFELSADFVDVVVAVTGEPLDAIRQDPAAHGRALLIELLAWQFASPVRWIETMDLLIEQVDRVVEIGPAAAPVLGRMFQSTLRSAEGSLEILHAAADPDAVIGTGPEVEEAPEDEAEPEPVAVAAVAAPVAAAPAAAEAIEDAAFTVEDALRALVALQLGQPLAAADGERSLDELLGGNSARRNQVLLDLGQEFGVGAMDGAHEQPLGQLAQAVAQATRGRYVHPGAYLKAAQDAALKGLGTSRKKAQSTLERRFGLPAGRQAAVLTVLAAEGGGLDEAVAAYGRRVGRTFAEVKAVASAGGAAAASGEATELAQGRWRALARAALVAGGLDPTLLDRPVPELADEPEAESAPGARFDPAKHVALTAAEHWARADALRLACALDRGEPADLSPLVRLATPALLAVVDDLAAQRTGAAAKALQAVRAQMADAVDKPGRWAHETAVITGAGPDSIAEAVVAELLAGGARVVVTTSRPTRARRARFKGLYRAHAARGAELHVVPLDQGDLAAVDAFVQWLYEPAFEARGAAKVQVKAGWQPTLCFPFGAMPAEGDPSEYDARIVRSLTVNLIGVERLVAALGRAAQAHHGPVVHTVLPLSPNHGQMGRDGLYAESKAALEAMLRKWHAEPAWAKGTTLCGARIGWVRGTGLMAGLDGVHTHVEQALGIQTFSPAQMAQGLLGGCEGKARAAAAQTPQMLDLTGGFGAQAGLRQLIEGALAAARADAKPAAQAEAAQALPYPDFSFPALPTQTSGPALDPAEHVAIVGYGEVGPYGNARVRWAMERDGALRGEAALELAWLTGCVRFEDGRWVDAESGEPAELDGLFERYDLGAKVGLRALTAFDPTHEVLYDEVVLSEPLRFSVPDRAQALAFQTLDPEHTRVFADGDGWQVVREAGSRVRVPRAQPLDRNVAGQLPDGWSAERLGLDPAMLDGMDPVAVYNLVATAEAFRSAGIDLDRFDQDVHPARVGCAQGSGIGGMRSLAKLYTESRLTERRQTDVLQETLINVTAAWPAMALYGAYGPMVNPVAACATAAVSLEVGGDLIRTGKADFVVAGAFDDLGPEGARGFADMNATIDRGTLARRGLALAEASRPCDRRRGGFVEAQGGGTLLLCRADKALALGLPIYGLLGGAWSRTDGLQRSVPAPGPGLLSIGAGGAKSPLSRALAHLGLTADDLMLASIHGTSTEANDVNETKLHADLAAAIGRRPGHVLPVTAQKALTGHSKGGAAAWQVAGALQAMADGVIPGMPNLEDPDPRLAGHTALAYPDRPIHLGPNRLTAALVTSLGFGHVGAAVLVVHPDVLLAGLPADARQAYAARRAEREGWRVTAEQAVRLGERPACAVRTPRDQDVAALLLQEGAAC